MEVRRNVKHFPAPSPHSCALSPLRVPSLDRRWMTLEWAPEIKKAHMIDGHSGSSVRDEREENADFQLIGSNSNSGSRATIKNPFNKCLSRNLKCFQVYFSVLSISIVYINSPESI